MKNEYTLIEDANLVSIKCHSSAKDRYETVVTDLEVFENIKKQNMVLKVYQTSGKPYIGCYTENSGNIVPLKKFVGDIVYGEGKYHYFTLINKNYLDMRKCNVIGHVNGEHHKMEFKKHVQELLEKQPKLTLLSNVANTEGARLMENQKKYGIVAEDNDTITTVTEPEIGIVKNNDEFWLTKDNETFCSLTKTQLKMIRNLMNQKNSWFND